MKQSVTTGLVWTSWREVSYRIGFARYSPKYDRIASKLLPTIEAGGIKAMSTPPIGEPPNGRRGAKVNLVG